MMAGHLSDLDEDNSNFDDADEPWTEPLNPATNSTLICSDFIYKPAVSKIGHSRTIIHFDIDCFYAQVEMLRNPELRNKPVGIQQKNIVVTTNYIARQCGVPKSSYVSDAKKICSDLVLVCGEDLTNYRQMSYRISEFLQKFTPCVERLGFDENFIDASELVQKRLQDGTYKEEFVGHVYHGNCQGIDRSHCRCGCELRLQIGSQIAAEIREALHKELGITSCAGIGHNKLLAKVVAGTHKPSQQTTVLPHLALDLLSSFSSVLCIPGIGYRTSQRLNALGVSSVVDLQAADKKMLVKEFGPQMAQLMNQLSCGVDDGPVVAYSQPQTLSDEDAFRCCKEIAEVEQRIKELTTSLLKRVAEDGRIPQTVRLTVRRVPNKYHRETRQCPIPGNIFTKFLQLGVSEGVVERLMPILMNLFSKLVDPSKPFHLTLIGVCFAKLKAADEPGSIGTFFTKAETLSQCAESNLVTNKTMDKQAEGKCQRNSKPSSVESEFKTKPEAKVKTLKHFFPTANTEAHSVSLQKCKTAGWKVSQQSQSHVSGLALLVTDVPLLLTDATLGVTDVALKSKQSLAVIDVPVTMPPTITDVPMTMMPPAITDVPMAMMPPAITDVPMTMMPPAITDVPMAMMPPAITDVPMAMMPPAITDVPMAMMPPTITDVPMAMMPPTITDVPMTMMPPTITDVPMTMMPPTVTDVPMTMMPPTITDVPMTMMPPTITDVPITSMSPATTDVPMSMMPPTITDVPITSMSPATTDVPMSMMPPTITDIPVTVMPPTITDVPLKTMQSTITDEFPPVTHVPLTVMDACQRQTTNSNVNPSQLELIHYTDFLKTKVLKDVATTVSHTGYTGKISAVISGNNSDKQVDSLEEDCLHKLLIAGIDVKTITELPLDIQNEVLLQYGIFVEDLPQGRRFVHIADKVRTRSNTTPKVNTLKSRPLHAAKNKTNSKRSLEYSFLDTEVADRNSKQRKVFGIDDEMTNNESFCKVTETENGELSRRAEALCERSVVAESLSCDVIEEQQHNIEKTTSEHSSTVSDEKPTTRNINIFSSSGDFQLPDKESDCVSISHLPGKESDGTSISQLPGQHINKAVPNGNLDTCTMGLGLQCNPRLTSYSSATHQEPALVTPDHIPSQPCSSTSPLPNVRRAPCGKLPASIDSAVFSSLPSNIRGEIMAHLAMGTLDSSGGQHLNLVAPDHNRKMKQIKNTKAKNSLLTYFKRDNADQK